MHKHIPGDGDAVPKPLRFYALKNFRVGFGIGKAADAQRTKEESRPRVRN